MSHDGSGGWVDARRARRVEFEHPAVLLVGDVDVEVGINLHVDWVVQRTCDVGLPGFPRFWLALVKLVCPKTPVAVNEVFEAQAGRDRITECEHAVIAAVGDIDVAVFVDPDAASCYLCC